MRGSGAADNPLEGASVAALEAEELRSLRQTLARLEAQVLEFKQKLGAYEAQLPAGTAEASTVTNAAMGENDTAATTDALPRGPAKNAGPLAGRASDGREGALPRGPAKNAGPLAGRASDGREGALAVEAAHAPADLASAEPVALDESIRDVLGYGFNLTGVVALTLGVAFVVRSSSAHNPATALAAVIAGSLALLGLGWLFRRREQARLAVWLEGAAVSIGYLAAYAAFGLLHSIGVVLLLSTAITAAAVVLAIARKSQAVAVFAVWGAVLTPLMMSGASKGQNPASALLFAYLALVSLSTLAVSRLHYWPWQAASALAATHFLAWMWYGEHRGGDTALTLLFPCVTFVVFLLRPLVRVVPAGWHDKAIASANPVFFFLALLTLLPDKNTPLALLGVGVAVALAAALLPRRTGLAATNTTLAALCLVPATWLISPLLAAYSWVAIGVATGVLGLTYSRWAGRICGGLLVVCGMAIYPRAFVVVPAWIAARWLLRRSWAVMPAVGDAEWLVRWALSLGTITAGLAALTLEIRAALGLVPLSALVPGAQFFYSLGIAAYAAALVVLGHNPSRRAFRACGWVVLAALIAKVFLLDLPALSGGWRIGSLLLLAASLLIVSAGRQNTAQPRQ